MNFSENQTFQNNTLLNPSETKNNRWIFLCLAIIPLWVIFGNFLVLMAVVCQRSLRTLSNYVIASLAFTDFLLALVVVPIGIYQIVNQKWELGLYICLLWTGSDVFLSTTSILHLCAIAIHRYYGISNPLRMRSTQETRHVTMLLLPAWLISFAISLPLIIQGAFYDSSAVLIVVPGVGPQCGIFDHTFAIYSSMVSYFVPLAIMVFADLRSVQILRNNVRIMSHKNGGRNHLSNHNLNSQLSSSTDRSQARHFVSKESSLYEMTLSENTSAAVSPNIEHPNNNAALSESSLVLEFTPHGTPTSQRRLALHPKITRKRSKSMGYIGMLATRGMVKINSRERRAEKTLIWVFACFVVFWMPFFTTNLTYGICRSCNIPHNVFLVFTWLGYISSGVNPCIYTLLNKDFRNAFKRLLMCHHSKMRRKIPAWTQNTRIES